MLSYYNPNQTYSYTIPTKKSLDAEFAPDSKDAESEDVGEEILPQQEEEEVYSSDEPSDSSSSDSDYDPSDDKELTADESYEYYTNESNLSEEDVSSSEDDEFTGIIEDIKELGRAHGEEIIDNICEDYYDINGIELDNETIEQALASIDLFELADALVEDYLDDEEEVDVESESEYSAELEETEEDVELEEYDEEEEEEEYEQLPSRTQWCDTLDIIDTIGESHQEIIADSIIETFKEINGIEPDFFQLLNVFNNIKEKLINEFEEDKKEEEYESDSSDEDYDENEDEESETESEESQDEEEEEEESYYSEENEYDSNEDDEFGDEYNEAIEIAKNIASIHREEIIENINYEYGSDIDDYQFDTIFKSIVTGTNDIKNNQEESNDDTDDDSDYDPSDDSFDYEQDLIDEEYY